MARHAPLILTVFFALAALIWTLSDYFDAGGKPDTELLASHIYCCEVSLDKYLDARMKG